MNWLLDLLFPRRAVCMGCGRMLGCERNDVCDDCREKLAKSWIGVRYVDSKTGLSGAAFAYGYHGVAGNLVRRLKYGAVRVLAEEMGADIAKAAVLMRIDHVDVVTAVPMHPKRERLRGCNHGEVLAKVVARRMNLPCRMLLMRRRNDVQQARLSVEERSRNLEGAFALIPGLEDQVKDKIVLLIDDVYTTGATVRECASELRNAGAAKVYFAGYAISTQGKRRKKNG